MACCKGSCGAAIRRFIRSKKEKLTWKAVQQSVGWYATRIAVVIVWCALLWAILGNDALPKLPTNSTVVCLPALDDSDLNSGAFDELVDALGVNTTAVSMEGFSEEFLLIYNESGRTSLSLVEISLQESCPSRLETTVSVTVPGNFQNVSVVNSTHTVDLRTIISNTLTPHNPSSLLAVQQGHFFALAVLLIAAGIGGYLVGLIHLPPLLGMLLAGFILANVPVINIAVDISPVWSASLRNVALVVILTRGGISLDARQLRRLKFAVPLLAFTPCLVEGAIDGLVAIFYLNMPWQWGLLLGYILAAVSPAVVVPSVLTLQEKGLGVDKGIPTLILAAASMDDVIAISLFGVFLGLAFSEGNNLVLEIFRAPIELCVGLLYGVLFGLLLWLLPTKLHTAGSRSRNRFFLLFGLGLFSVFGSRRAIIGGASLAGAGALGVLTVAFIAAQGWDGPGKKVVARVFGLLWQFAQPLLFGLIGAAVILSNINPALVGQGILLVCIGLVARLIVSVIAVTGNGFTIKEKIFIAIAWLPKATVQAAVGSIALDEARERNAGEESLRLGRMVLTIAVLSILLTAPLGAVGISITGPLLLNKKKKEEEDKQQLQEGQEEVEGDEETGIGNGQVVDENGTSEPQDSHSLQETAEKEDIEDESLHETSV